MLLRPANADEGSMLQELIDEIIKNTRSLPLILPK
jgi:hypothetical protein